MSFELGSVEYCFATFFQLAAESSASRADFACSTFAWSLLSTKRTSRVSGTENWDLAAS